MISEELKGIVDKFKEQGKMNFFDGIVEEKIQAFEKEKGVTLPLKYKEWLLFSDGGELFLPAGVRRVPSSGARARIGVLSARLPVA